MGGFFGVAAKEDCVFDLFFGTDYHSHLGTRRAGLAVYDLKKGFDRAIHNIETRRFGRNLTRMSADMRGFMGIGCISDYEPQPLLVTLPLRHLCHRHSRQDLITRIRLLGYFQNRAHAFSGDERRRHQRYGVGGGHH